MPASEADLYALLDTLGVAHRTLRHRPVFTVEEGADIKAKLPGGHTKNLFLKDKKGALYLLSALGDTAIDLNAVSRCIGAARFSFGNAELLLRHLGVTPGSVTVFALINDRDAQVRLILDEGLFDHALVNFHPLTNEATTAVTPTDLLRFLAATGHAPIRLRFGNDGAPQPIDPTEPEAHVDG